MDKKLKKLIDYLSETIEYFLQKIQNVNKDLYFANRDIRYILDKSINDIILCIVDICEEILKINKRSIPDTYKDTILACYEFIGDLALKLAPLAKCRNEIVHQYLKVNWQNIQIVYNKITEIQEFIKKIKDIFLN
ncbi:MAG: putative HEPN domain protein YutE [Thermodesulfobacteria bacterium]|nr:DUF86 domain-containing protein [Thermodesulfobacteriota bacterium]MCU4138315.1 putative HEPN domain protein YutE [Thermodesulfobacteriota bacterium]